MTGVLNYSTSISAEKTIGEMQRMLAAAGASRIAVDYSVEGRACGMSFHLPTPHGERVFNLPVDMEAMLRLLVRQWNQGKIRSGGSKAKMTSPDQAERVAWRVMKDWLAAQLALVATQMATLDQVMLPYLNMNGRSLYSAYKQQEESALMLEAGA